MKALMMGHQNSEKMNFAPRQNAGIRHDNYWSLGWIYGRRLLRCPKKDFLQ